MALTAKKYVELVNPEEVALENRDYRDNKSELIEMYDLDDLHSVDDRIYYDDDNDLFWIRRNINGYYVETYRFDRSFDVADAHELEVICDKSLAKVNQWFYAIPKPQGVDEEDFEDAVFLLLEKE